MSTRNFPTALGVASVWWNEHGLTRFHLPDAAAKIIGGAPPLAPPAIEDVIHRTQNHFAGKLHDFADVALDWSVVTPFQKKVYVAAMAVKPGHTTTYGEIARHLGLGPEGSRAVGVAWPAHFYRGAGARGRRTRAGSLRSRNRGDRSAAEPEPCRSLLRGNGELLMNAAR